MAGRLTFYRLKVFAKPMNCPILSELKRIKPLQNRAAKMLFNE